MEKMTYFNVFRVAEYKQKDFLSNRDKQGNSDGFDQRLPCAVATDHLYSRVREYIARVYSRIYTFVKKNSARIFITIKLVRNVAVLVEFHNFHLSLV